MSLLYYDCRYDLFVKVFGGVLGKNSAAVLMYYCHHLSTIITEVRVFFHHVFHIFFSAEVLT